MWIVRWASSSYLLMLRWLTLTPMPPPPPADTHEAAEEELLLMDNNGDELRGGEGRGGASDRISPPAVAAPLTCSICMEPWICNGGHRICYIPCGHVYGRLCLEKWLDIGGGEAKCPQCGAKFKRHQITNLYAQGSNLWSCCKEHANEVGEYYKSKHKKIGRYLTSLRARCEEQGERLDEIAADAKSINRRLDALEAFLESDLQTMGEQMRKMATQEKATAMDLIEFMEQHLSKPPDPDPFAL